jgi:hypothetical protein
MADSVSPLTTVYLEPEDFLPVALDFEGVDFFFAEVLEAMVFLGADEATEGVTFFVPLKE